MADELAQLVKAEFTDIEMITPEFVKACDNQLFTSHVLSEEVERL